MGLLGIPARENGLSKLSDLHCLPRKRMVLRCTAARLPIEAFSTYEWPDAAEYLCGAKCRTAEEAKQIIMSF